MRMKHILAIIIIVSVTCFACKEKRDDSTAIITFTIGNVTVNNNPARAKQHLKRSDILRTGNESIAVIQVREDLVITVTSNTEIAMREILSDKTRNEIALELQRGYVFSKLLSKKYQYSVKTPTIVASVRGTSFAVAHDKKTGRDSIKLLEGRVAITAVEKSDERYIGTKVEGVYLDPGKKIEFTSGAAAETSALNVRELEELKKIDTIRPVPNEEMSKVIDITKQEPDKDRPEKSAATSITALSEPQKEQVVQAFSEGKSAVMKEVGRKIVEESLTEMKIQNRGQLDVITLEDGRSIKGVLLERGLIYKIKTPRGIIKVPREDVASQTIIR